MTANKNPIISIIIPTYNSESTLGYCLNSVTKQTFSNIEIWIIDGVSNDNTLNIVKEYSNSFSYINCISEKDKGIYDAMNKGIKKAKGDWLYFLGSDDTFYSETILAEIFEHGAPEYDLIYGNVSYKKSNIIYDNEFSYPKLLDKNICHQAIFAKKDIFKRIGLFNLKYKACADWDHNLKLFKSDKISKIYIDKTIAIYNENGFSAYYRDTLFKNRIALAYIQYNKNKISFLDKLRMIKEILTRSVNSNSKKDLLLILFKTPALFV